MDMFLRAAALAVINNRIIEAILNPLKAKFPEWDFWWMMYVAWVTGGVISYLAGFNIFEPLFPDQPILGAVYTAIAIGGGSNLLADIIDALKGIFVKK